MGIRGLNTFIKKVCPECITTNKIEKYSGKTFGIDASILLYKYRHISNIDESCVNSHIIGFLNRIKYYLNNKITPVFIFDGTPPEQKKITLKKRQSIKRKIYEKIEILQDLTPDNVSEQIEIDKEINNLSRQIINVTKTHISDVKKLLDILGINYYDAPDEAEKYCVYLQQNKIIDYIVTDDTDVFTFGGVNVLKSSIKNDLIETNIEQFLEKIGYTKLKFIDFCILSGCDYLSYVPNLAINTVYTLFKKLDNIEDIIKLNKYSFPEEYNNIEELKNIRSIFYNFNYEKPKLLQNKIINKNEFKNYLETMNIKNSTKLIEKF
jgi:flap endonuclease-1